MELKPLRIIALSTLLLVAFLFGRRCRAENTNSTQLAQIEAAKAIANAATNRPATNAPAEPLRTPVYVLNEFTVYRTPVGPLVQADPLHVKALTRLWPSTTVTVLWTQDGPVQFAEPSEALDQFQRNRGTNLVFWRR